MGFFIISCSNAEDYKYLAVEEYKSRVYASWIGQIIGNTYGLSYEFKFIEDPGPDIFPYGYGWTLDLLEQYDGAFSDDDTDIEYMYLTQMEEHGIEPTYAQLREAWLSHVKERVWAANRQALTLMHAGHYPPITGSKEYNTQWTQIDPQLVNEIWAFTAPGMIDYAVEKSRFMAHITNDGYGIEPTLVYAAMYSSAFFENDIEKLIEIGQSALNPDSHFNKAIESVKELHDQYPYDWKTARKAILDTYYFDEKYTNPYAWKPIDATLNGALGIMALLYGEGDFQKTLDLSSALGMDADNQAATMSGLLALINGIEGIPDDLLYPLPDHDWDKPFNDQYKMITREILLDANLTEMAERMAKQGEKIILAKGGSIVTKNGVQHYKIPSNASFTPPFEFNLPEIFHAETGIEFNYPVYIGGVAEESRLHFLHSDFEDLTVEDSQMKSVFDSPGIYRFELLAKHQSDSISQEFQVHVHSQNLAKHAEIIGFDDRIKDGSIFNTLSSEETLDPDKMVEFGFLFDQDQKISTLSLNTGMIPEFRGWMTSLKIKYRNDEGKLVSVRNLKTFPDMNFENNQWLKPHFMTYWFSFDPVETKEIIFESRVGGVREDGSHENEPVYYSISVSEIGAYAN